ncbi:hypothetical protein WDW89_13315 [Deltaproteobacteria bacterium TL4]
MRVFLIVVCCLLFSVASSYAQPVINFDYKPEDLVKIPSPVEVITQGKKLNILTDIRETQEVLKYAYKRAEPERNAVYLGRTLAILLLALDNFDHQTLSQYLFKIKEALIALDIPRQYVDRLEIARVQIASKRWTRDKIIRQIDLVYAELVNTVSPQQSKNHIYRIIQGSAWMQGQNLLAQAIKKRKQYDSAKVLLYQPIVADLVVKYLKEAKATGGSSTIIDGLLVSMQKYQDAVKAPKIGPTELEIIINETEKFLVL